MTRETRSQNLSIMLTDIQGYSDASAVSSRNEIVELIRRHNKLMHPVIEFYGGTVVKGIGDALLCTFPSATDAVVCAIIIQLLLKEYNLRQQEDSRRMNLRVVINTGDVSLEEGDIYGDAVNATARMEGLECFPGGSIGISEATYLMMNRNEIVADKVGAFELKGISEPVTVYQVPLDKQKLNAIPAKLLQLVERVVAGSGRESRADLQEWTRGVQSFLEEKNWGENLQKLGRTVENTTRKISQTLAGPSVASTRETNQLKDAAVGRRVKTFLIDAVVLIIIQVLLMAGWWIATPIIFGAHSITQDDFISRSLNSAARRQFKADYDFVSDRNGVHYVRRQGLVEKIISLSIRFPVLLWVLYFACFWMLKGASPGQLSGGTAVVDRNGGPIGFAVAGKRAGIFVFSLLCLGIGGMWYYFKPERQTFWDEQCETRVVE